MRPRGYTGEGNHSRQPVSYPGHPAMSPIALRKDRGDAERQDDVAGRKTVPPAKHSSIRLVPGVSVIATQGNIARPNPASRALQRQGNDVMVQESLAGQQRRILGVLVLPHQSHGIKRCRKERHRYRSLAAAEDAIEICEIVRPTEVRRVTRVQRHHPRRQQKCSQCRCEMLALTQLDGKKPDAFLVLEDVGDEQPRADLALF